MENIIKRHEFKFKVVGCTMLIVGVLKFGEAIATNLVLKNTEERLKNLEVASAGYGEHITYLFEKIRKLEENA